MGVQRRPHPDNGATVERSHLFPESDAALRDRLDELFVPATEQ